jgi:hypothetical protein
VSPKQRFYLVGQNCIGAALANAAINWTLGWALTRNVAQLPMWGLTSVAGDLTGTAFGVTFGTSLFMAFQVRWDLARGKIAPIALSGSLETLIRRLPDRTLRRGLRLGALSVPVFALPVVACLVAFGVQALHRLPFLALKSCFSAIEGAVVTPFIVLATLSEVAAQGSQKDPAL